MQAERLPEKLAQEIERRYCTDQGLALPSERHLSHLLGASRAMVREALTILRARGSIASERGRSPVALSAPPEPTRAEMSEARAVLEGEIAAIAAMRAGPAGYLDLREDLRRMFEAESPQDYWIAEERLHLTLLRIAQNSVLMSLTEPMVRAAYRLGPDPDLIGRMRLHQRLTAAVGRAQPQLARDIMTDLLSHQVLSPTKSG